MAWRLSLLLGSPFFFFWFSKVAGWQSVNTTWGARWGKASWQTILALVSRQELNMQRSMQCAKRVTLQMSVFTVICCLKTLEQRSKGDRFSSSRPNTNPEVHILILSSFTSPFHPIKPFIFLAFSPPKNPTSTRLLSPLPLGNPPRFRTSGAM